jgi:hypothetical protein
MSTPALVMWLSAVLIVTGFTIYFFYRILTIPQPPVLPDDDEAPDGFKTFDVT